MKLNHFIVAVSALLLMASASSCEKVQELDTDLENLKGRVEALEEAAAGVNNEAVALRKLMVGKTTIVGLENQEDGYVLALSDGTEVRIVQGTEENAIVPIIGINADSQWIVSVDGGKTFQPIAGSDNPADADGKTPDVRIDAEGFWEMSLDGGKSWKPLLDADGEPMSSKGKGKSSFFKEITPDKANAVVRIQLQDGQVIEIPYVADFDLELVSLPAKPQIFLGQTLEYEVRMSGIKEAMFQLPEGWAARLTEEKFELTAPSAGKDGDYDIVVIGVSEKGYLKKFTFVFQLVAKVIDESNCKVWNDFVAGNEDNVLLDYSYAGYNHGESAPAEAATLGYDVFDVTDYGAIPNDGKSDREAFLACVDAALGNVGYKVTDQNITFNAKEKANAIVYFPEGEFILHTAEDNTEGKNLSRAIQIRAGNFILRGAGRDKTVILMKDPNLPKDPAVLYSSPVMLEFKHNSGLSTLSKVTSAAEQGSFSVEVASAAGIAAGDWVCLSLLNNDPALVAEELHPYKVTDRMTDIKNGGVRVQDFHQVRAVQGNKITFVEPIMRAVDPKWGWEIMKYPHYENVGIEDLCFKGNAKDHFVHHGSWEDDGAFKPLNMVRLTNSWLRRVKFTSVSEACSIQLSANVSAYDIIFDGRRGHGSVRSAGSSRVFIGATLDQTGGYLIDQPSVYQENAGQYHAVGVSKPSMGAVLWRNVWGNDSCFESHASQPRATLIDCCRGGWMRWRQGGDESQVPNHLNDLTIWNFVSTTPYSGQFIWWDANSKWWKFVMPVVVGFSGEACTFAEDQMKLSFSNGIPVNPASLYEAQLQQRLGFVPAWLLELKNK